MIDSKLLQILCCPETYQPLREADAALLAKVNQSIAGGGVQNRGGQPVTEKIDGGLVRADGKYLYPIRLGIPVMLVDSAIALAPTG